MPLRPAPAPPSPGLCSARGVQRRAGERRTPLAHSKPPAPRKAILISFSTSTSFLASTYRVASLLQFLLHAVHTHLDNLLPPPFPHALRPPYNTTRLPILVASSSPTNSP
ncbi:hypothetical protein CEP52_007063 [Fusarium oligoseptatum]|uniref:Uncharacterized protein n=1 Tax=Fusarium oligoseptatum TaxID=2604345 RepID=A0A428TPS3_9HYPO|nr:hypothetical protein CEP52_007063 [Fusarium oligoseptatum]